VEQTSPSRESIFSSAPTFGNVVEEAMLYRFLTPHLRFSEQGRSNVDRRRLARRRQVPLELLEGRLLLSSTVALVSTTTKLTSSANPVVLNNPVTLTATVTPATTSTSPALPAPSGSVEFYDGSADLGSGMAGSTGVWTLSTSFSTANSHALKAVYRGDSTYATSTGTLAQSVSTVTTTHANVPAPAANTSVAGQTATPVVAVNGSTSQTSGATDAVTVTDGSKSGHNHAERRHPHSPALRRATHSLRPKSGRS
jgi:hypothetical protein